MDDFHIGCETTWAIRGIDSSRVSSDAHCLYELEQTQTPIAFASVLNFGRLALNKRGFILTFVKISNDCLFQGGAHKNSTAHSSCAACRNVFLVEDQYIPHVANF